MQLMGRAAPQPVMKPHPCGRTGARRRRNAPALRRYVHGPGVDEPLVWYEGAGVADRRWLHADRQGSIIGVSNGAGAVTPYAYGPWGEPSDWTGPRFRYTGQATFPEAQAYHYKARVYDPAMGRFLQTDPIGQADDPNLYAYVRGDPVNMGDPSGLEGCGTRIAGQDSANCNSISVSDRAKEHLSAMGKAFDGAKAGLERVRQNVQKTTIVKAMNLMADKGGTVLTASTGVFGVNARMQKGDSATRAVVMEGSSTALSVWGAFEGAKIGAAAGAMVLGPEAAVPGAIGGAILGGDRMGALPDQIALAGKTFRSGVDAAGNATAVWNAEMIARSMPRNPPQ